VIFGKYSLRRKDAKRKRSILAVAGVAGFALFLTASFRGAAQDNKPKHEVFSGTGYGPINADGEKLRCHR